MPSEIQTALEKAIMKIAAPKVGSTKSTARPKKALTKQQIMDANQKLARKKSTNNGVKKKTENSLNSQQKNELIAECETSLAIIKTLKEKSETSFQRQQDMCNSPFITETEKQGFLQALKNNLADIRAAELNAENLLEKAQRIKTSD